MHLLSYIEVAIKLLTRNLSVVVIYTAAEALLANLTRMRPDLLCENPFEWSLRALSK